MSSMINPYIAGCPITGPEMFFGREDVFTFIRQALVGKHRDNIIVLYGQRRTGKTSTLYQLPTRLGPHYLCVFVDLQALQLQGIDGFLWELANQIQRVLQREHHIELPPLDRQAFMADARTFFQYIFLDQVWTAIGDRHILLMLDEAIRLEEQVREGKMENHIFEYVSHLMQHYERLNFLFSLGSGLEEMEREYALLFRTAVYKKISFLSHDETIALMVNPVKEYYEIEPAAQEFILRITSGHPYCTQLLCHSLFNRWQLHPIRCITVSDVEAVLDEVVERGLAVFKYVWEESNLAEKAVMVAIASVSSSHDKPASCNDISRAWKHYSICLPPRELATALKSLTAREVIRGEDGYTFTIRLQRRWIQKYRRFEWVGEETAETMHEWKCPTNTPLAHLGKYATPSGVRDLNWRTLLLNLLVLALLCSGLIRLAFFVGQRADQTAGTAPSAVLTQIFPFTRNKPVLEDSLINDKGNYYGWDTIRWPDHYTGCSLSSDGYHAFSKLYSRIISCDASNGNSFGDFSFQAVMNIKKGDVGGLNFRAQEVNGIGYGVMFDFQGDYQIFIERGGGKEVSPLRTSTTPAKSFRKGFNQANIIGVSMRKNHMQLYINNQNVETINDSSLNKGLVGFLVYDMKTPTEVVYTNAKVWQLP